MGSKKVVVEKKLGFSEAEFRAKHDNMFKIREGLGKLEDGRYLTDQQMREFCGVNPAKWRGYADSGEFDDYKIKVTGGGLYWGTVKCIKRLKADLNIG